MEITDQLSVAERRKAISELVRKTVGLFSGVTTLLSVPSLISPQLSRDKLYYKQGNSICPSLPHPQDPWEQ